MDAHTWLTLGCAALSSITSTVATLAVIKTDIRWIKDALKSQERRIEHVEARI